MKIMNVRSMVNMTANENDKYDENKETDAYYKMMKILIILIIQTGYILILIN